MAVANLPRGGHRQPVSVMARFTAKSYPQSEEKLKAPQNSRTVKTLRMAILAATGTARKRIIPAIRDLDSCAIVAVHGLDPVKLRALATSNSIQDYFPDAEKMLDQTERDFVFVGSPPIMHRENIQLCVERNVPILCEKPLCLSRSEVESIYSLVSSRQAPFRLAHHARHQPGVPTLRSLISDRAFGKLLRVAMQWFLAQRHSTEWKLEVRFFDRRTERFLRRRCPCY
jgi:predicted dehydrogenase